MLNLDREIRPEDFAIDPERIWWTDHPEGREAKRAYFAEKEELKRLYELQEEAKAKAHFKAGQLRKDVIPFSESLAIEICHRVSAGEFLINICKDKDMPTVRSVTQWRKDLREFELLYKDAVLDRLEIFEDQLVTIADESENDFKLLKKGGKQVRVLDAEVISRPKLRVDVRKAHLKAYRPERWGEQSTLNVNNYDAMDPNNMSQEELDRVIAELETKDAVVREPKAA
jgi:Bacteriophage Sf6, terminase small subunit-like